MKTVPSELFFVFSVSCLGQINTTVGKSNYGAIGYHLISFWLPACLPSGYPLVSPLATRLSSLWLPTCFPSGYPSVFPLATRLFSLWLPVCLPSGYPLVSPRATRLSSLWLPA